MFGAFGLCKPDEEEEGPSKLKRAFNEVAGIDTEADENLKKKFAPTAPQQPAEQGTGAATGTAKEHRRVPLRYVELEKELEGIPGDEALSGAAAFAVYDVLRLVNLNALHIFTMIFSHCVSHATVVYLT